MNRVMPWAELVALIAPHAPMFCEFAELNMGEDHLSDENTILRFRHLLEKHT